MVSPAAEAAVTLQVNVAPSDLLHADATLRHQLRQWGTQVAQVIYTLDLRKSAGPRGEHFEAHKPRIERLLADIAGSDTGRRVIEVDYHKDAVRRIGDMFFGGKPPPAKDCFGAPFYGYFYGLAMVDTRYVLHMDCDMLFGGGSGTWMRDAIELLSSRPEVLFISPLAGPPTADARISRNVRRAQKRTQMFGSTPVLESRDPRTYRLRHVSSRVFLADLDRLRELAPFAIMRAPAWTYGSDLATTPFLPAETVLSRALHDRGCLRLDYLGAAPGMWFVHPSQRGAAFVENLPNVIAGVESGAVPDNQRGHFNLTDEWLSAVGPTTLDRPAAAMSVRGAARWLAWRSGALAVRSGVRRFRWRRGGGSDV
jgi:hypothetical protein